MSIRENNAHATRNPVQPRPASLPEDRRTKRGPGTSRTAASIVGPAIEQPLTNSAAQSDRSNTAAYGSIPINRGAGTNARTISRDGLTDGLESGGRGPGAL